MLLWMYKHTYIREIVVLVCHSQRWESLHSPSHFQELLCLFTVRTRDARLDFHQEPAGGQSGSLTLGLWCRRCFSPAAVYRNTERDALHPSCSSQTIYISSALLLINNSSNKYWFWVSANTQTCTKNSIRISSQTVRKNIRIMRINNTVSATVILILRIKSKVWPSEGLVSRMKLYALMIKLPIHRAKCLSGTVTTERYYSTSPAFPFLLESQSLWGRPCWHICKIKPGADIIKQDRQRSLTVSLIKLSREIKIWRSFSMNVLVWRTSVHFKTFTTFKDRSINHFH